MRVRVRVRVTELGRGGAVFTHAPEQLGAVEPRAQEARVALEQLVVRLALHLGAVPLARREVRCPGHRLPRKCVVGKVLQGLPVRRHRLVVPPLGEEHL